MHIHEHARGGVLRLALPFSPPHASPSPPPRSRPTLDRPGRLWRPFKEPGSDELLEQWFPTICPPADHAAKEEARASRSLTPQAGAQNTGQANGHAAPPTAPGVLRGNP